MRIWAPILYFHTASDTLGHKGHCIGMFVHGDFWVNLDAFAIDIFFRFGQREFAMSILPPVFLCLTKRIAHDLPVLKQKPQGLSVSLRCGSCSMWLPICRRSSGPLMLAIGVLEHRLQHCSSLQDTSWALQLVVRYWFKGYD